MRILLVGGTGFIGPEIVRRLAAGKHSVTVFHRGKTQAAMPAGVREILGDRHHLPDFTSDFQRLAPDVVVDVIAGSEQQAQTLVHTFAAIARRLVVLSSGDVYRAYDILHRKETGPIEPVPLKEDAPLRQNLYHLRGSPYLRSADPRSLGWVTEDYEKILVEQVVMGQSELPGTILRLPMVYGPGDSSHRFFPYLKRMDDRRRAILLDEGTATWRSTWGYVTNVAEAVALAVENDRAAGRIYNVSERQALSMGDWVRELGQTAGWKGRIVIASQDCPPPNLASRLNAQQHLATDTTRIREELGYREPVSREEALQQTVAWERSHPPAEIDPALFDYETEDRLLAEFDAGRQDAGATRDANRPPL